MEIEQAMQDVHLGMDENLAGAFKEGTRRPGLSGTPENSEGINVVWHATSQLITYSLQI